MKKLIFSLVGLFFVLGTVIVVSYAWFINGEFKEPEVSGYSIAAYFASGNGTEEKPYEITNKRHLYNLAWLQYLGEFNKYTETTTTENGEEVTKKTLNQQYYFKLSASRIDLSGFSLPPIGTEENPFVGVFNGNGCVIDNLTTSNDIDELNNKPLASKVTKDNIKALNIIGLFGVVGNYNSMYTTLSVVPSVQNFYLDKITISSIAENTLIGVIAGYVAPSGNISNIGVHYSSFKFASGVGSISTNTFVSKYTLLGDYDSEQIGWEDKPTSGGTGTGEVGYGASMNLEEVYNAIYAANGGTKMDDKQVIPFKIDDDETTDDIEAGSENMGFFIGGEINAYQKTSKDIDKTTYYYPAGASNCVYTLPYSENGEVVYPAPSQNIIDATFGSESDYYYCLRLQAKLDVSNNLVTIENTYVNGESVAKLVVPRRCIWFKPRTAGNLEFVMVNPGDGENFTLTKIQRNTKGDYSSGMTTVTTLIETNYMGMLSPGSSNININGSWSSVDYSDLAYFFSFEVTQDDIDAGYEYCITRDNGSNGAYFWYLDIGSNAGAGDGSTETPTYSANISSIDFVYSTGTTTYEDRTVNVLALVTDENYIESGVLLTISGTAVTIECIYFKRNEELTEVLHCITSDSGVEITDSGFTITNIGSGTDTSDSAAVW